MGKKHYLSVLAAIMLSIGQTATAQEARTSVTPKTDFNRLSAMTSRPVVNKESSSMKVPRTEAIYKWYGGEWKIATLNKQTLNEKLLTVSQECTYYDIKTGNVKRSEFVTYKYDGNDNKTEEIVEKSGNKGDSKFRIVYTYDDVCTDVIKSTESYVWDDTNEDWVRSMEGECLLYNQYFQFERDAFGRVTVNQSWLSSEMTKPLSKGYYFNYTDADSHASEMKVKNKDAQGNFADIFVYKDIVWRKTNDQFLKLNEDAFRVFNEDPDNQAESFTLYRVENGGQLSKVADVKNVYDKQDRILKELILDAYGKNYARIYTYDVAPGDSYNFLYCEWEDLNDNGTYDEGEINYLGLPPSYSEVRYDEHNNYVSNIEYFYNQKSGEFGSIGGDVWEYTYLEDGTLKEKILTHSSRNGESNNIKKYVYDDFADPGATNIDEVTGEASELIVYDGYVLARNLDGAEYTITDLQGRFCNKGIVSGGKISISNLADGLYIVSVNGKSVKVMNK